MKFKFILLVILLLINLSTKANSSSPSNFIEARIINDFKITHKIKNANLLDLPVDQLIVLGENDKEGKILVIYELLQEEFLYSEVARIAIPKNYLAFDLLKNKHKSKLIFLTNHSLIEYDAATNKFVHFADSQSIYLQEEADYLVERDFIDDFNGDGLDDISIVGFNGIHFLFQNKQGEFTQQTINIKPLMQADENRASYKETKLFYADINQDQKHDLIQVQDASLKVYFQKDDGLFSPEAHQIELTIDVKALDWWVLKGSDGESIDQNNISHRTVYLIEDINNDTISDLVVLFNQTKGVLDRQNNYEIYLGKVINDRVSFDKEPNSVIRSEGTISSFKLEDLNGDEKSEIIVTSLDIGLSQIIGALLSGSIDQDIYFFKMDENDNFSVKPIVEKEVELGFSLSSGKSDDPVVKLADFNGDNLQDLMLSDGEKTLRFFKGSNTKKLFDTKASEYSILLPKNGSLIQASDLNNDGKDDLIIRYAKQDDKELQNQLVILFAK